MPNVGHRYNKQQNHNGKDEEFSLNQSAKFNTMENPLPRDAATQYSPDVSQKNFKPKSKGIYASRETEHSHEEDVRSYANSLSFVKVVDPEATLKTNDKRDNNDCKKKQTLRAASRKDRGGTAETAEDLKNITGRANSSLNSRQANPSMPQ